MSKLTKFAALLFHVAPGLPVAAIKDSNKKIKSLITIIGLFATSSLLSQETPVFYAIHSGEKYEQVTWNRALTEDDFEKLCETTQVFDSYTLEREAGKVRKVSRTYSSPSGDWRYALEYHYQEDGVLTKIISDFVTLTGFDAELDDFLPTRCERKFVRNEEGEFIKVSEKITDSANGKVAKRSISDPKIEHWTPVSKIPNPTREEKEGADEPVTAPESKSDGRSVKESILDPSQADR